MEIKKYFKKSYIFSFFIIFLLVTVSTLIPASELKNFNSKNNKMYNFINPFKEVIQNEWFDGNFKGYFGKNKECSDGKIWGDFNLERTSSIGKIFGKWKTFNNESYGSFQGRFRDSLLTGLIRTNNEVRYCFFFGFLSFNKTSFQVVVFGLKTNIKYIRGIFESSFLPPLTGPYGVGIKNMHLIDENRSEEFTENDPDDFREMMIRIWYPIDKEVKDRRVEYMDDSTFLWLKGRSPIPLFTVPDNAYLYVQPHGIIDGSLYEKEASWPVIIFSPGYDGVYQIYTSLIEDIVSNGFIVVSINHPYVSGVTVFPDGRKIYVSSGSTEEIGLTSVVGDAKFVLDEITKLNQSSNKLKGRFDLSKVGMYGHSFGGASTAICCYEDDRFLCGLTLDGVFYLNNMSDGLSKPFLMMLAENRFNDENAQDMWNLLYDDSYKVEVLGSTHYAYTDVGVLLNHLVPLIPNKLLGFGTIEPKRHVNITRMFELTFFEVYLKDRPKDDLINLASQFQEVNFEYK